MFTDAFAKRFGRDLHPDANTVNAYNGMLLLAGAMKQGKGDQRAVIAALDAGKIEGPNGPLAVIQHYASQQAYIGRASGDGTIAVAESSPPIAPKVNCDK